MDMVGMDINVYILFIHEKHEIGSTITNSMTNIGDKISTQKM